MKRIKHFFAPCMELFVWQELKSTVLFSVASSQQAFGLFLKHLWWLFPVIFVMIVAASQTMLPLLKHFVFFDAVSGIAVPEVSTTSWMIASIISSFCAYFFSFVAILLMRPSREAKDWDYLMDNLNTYFVPALALFPAYLLLSGFGVFSTIWAFSILFFIESEPDFQSLKVALSRGFLEYMRFFPVVMVVVAASSICFAVVAISLWAAATWVIATFFGSFFIARLLIGLGAVAFVFFAAPLVFFHLAVINTLHVKIMSKFRGLFFKEEA